MKTNRVTIGNFEVGAGAPLVLIAGPCVIESEAATAEIAESLAALTHRLAIPLIFKASFDKANRTGIHSYRGPGLHAGLEILASIRKRFDIPVLSDIHRIEEAEAAADVLDVIQIPALLSRQTDLLLAAGRTGKPINIKKGQFLAPWDMRHVVEKIVSTGNRRLLLTDRGTMFGYNNLVSDFRGIKIMQDLGFPVVFDATHSVQLPGAADGASGGNREFAPVLARAGTAAGADGIFIEVHTDPDRALCDGPNSIRLGTLSDLLPQLKAIRKVVDAPAQR